MSAAGLSLVLVAAFCHAFWNFLVKRLNAGPELVWLFSVLSMLIYLPFVIWFAASMPVPGLVECLAILGSATIHLGYFLLLQAGYRTGDLSLVYPVARATGPILSTAFAVLILGENPSVMTGMGGAIIITGVLCLTGGGGGGKRILISLGFGLAVGVLIGSYTVLDAWAVSALMIPPIILDYFSSVGRVVILAPLAYRRRVAVRILWRDHWRAVLGIAIFSPLAYILVLFALTFTPVIYVAPLRESSVLITVLLGSFLLGEGQITRRLFWALVILAGVAVLAVSS